MQKLLDRISDVFLLVIVALSSLDERCVQLFQCGKQFVQHPLIRIQWKRSC